MKSKSSYQILVSLDALTTLYNILCSLLREVQEVDLLFRIETDAQRPGQMDRETGDFHTFDDDYLKANILPEHTKQILKLQDARKTLQKLPQFPDADLCPIPQWVGRCPAHEGTSANGKDTSQT